MSQAGTERLRTERTSLPADLVAVGDALLFGYPSRPRPEDGTAVGDVLALHGRELNRLPEAPVPGLLDDPAFVRAFRALHRSYRAARLLRPPPADGKLPP